MVVVRRGRFGSVAAVRKIVLSVMNCGAGAFMADFEDGGTLNFGYLVTGQLNMPNAMLGEIDFSAPRARAQGNRGPGRGRAADGHRQPGMLVSGGHDAGPRRASSCRPTAVPAR
jgi:malate synthase